MVRYYLVKGRVQAWAFAGSCTARLRRSTCAAGYAEAVVMVAAGDGASLGRLRALLARVAWKPWMPLST
jgi:hypothetical protein